MRSKMEPLNTFSINKPQGIERFDYYFPIIKQHPLGKLGFIWDTENIDAVIVAMLAFPHTTIYSYGQLCGRNVTAGYVIDLYFQWHDYTNYRNKLVSFHHLN